MENENPWISVDDEMPPPYQPVRIYTTVSANGCYEAHDFTTPIGWSCYKESIVTHWQRIIAPNQNTSLDPESKKLKFWEAMREMQENHKRVRCLRWDRTHEKTIEWHLGDDIDLPSGMDWEDVMCEWEICEQPKKPSSPIMVEAPRNENMIFTDRDPNENDQLSNLSGSLRYWWNNARYYRLFYWHNDKWNRAI